MGKVLGTIERRSRAEWVELMTAYEGGDLSQREFCERQGVAYSTFGYWRKRLRSPTVPVMPAAEPLVELSPFGIAEDVRGWRVELDLGCGVTLRVR